MAWCQLLRVMMKKLYIAFPGDYQAFFQTFLFYNRNFMISTLEVIQMKSLTKISIFLLFVFLAPMQAFAVETNTALPSLNNVLFADSDACRSCLKDQGCDRENRSCEVLCKSTIFTNDDDLAGCSTNCVSKWASCDAKARSACSYYCTEDS